MNYELHPPERTFSVWAGIGWRKKIMQSFNHANQGSDIFDAKSIASHCSGIAFLLQKHCFFYCSSKCKLLNMNKINHTWEGGITNCL